jgi:hypothetical protein
LPCRQPGELEAPHVDDTHTVHSQDFSHLPTNQIPPHRALFSDSARFWETRRIFYNLALAAVVLLWITLSWPHFRPAFTLTALFQLFVLALIANALYCAAYLVDIPMQLSAFSSSWKRRRWMLWLLGTLLAILFANYWIADEIYPFIR